MEVFSPVAALAASLIDEPESQNSTRIEENISGELFNKPAAKAEKTDNRNKEEVHKKTSNKAKDTGKAPDLIPAKKTKNDHESMNPAKQAKNDYEILVPAKEKAKPEAKAAEEAKAKEEQAAKEKEDLAKIEKEKQEALRIEAERQAQAARANDAEAAAAEAEYREAHQKRLELEQLLEEKLKEKGLRDQKKQSEKSLNAEESNKLKNTNEEENTEEEQEKGLLEKIKEGLGLTDLQRADKELKKALKNKKNGLEEIQALLNSFEDKYDLSREDQAKLMADNTDAFKEFIERHGYENFDPQMFMVLNDDKAENEGLEISDLYDRLKEDRELTQEELEAGLTKVELPTSNEEESGFGFFRSAFRAVGAGNNSELQLDGKKFNIITRFDTSTVVGPIKKGQYFRIHLDNQLTVNDASTLKSITKEDGTVIATPSYNSKDNTITYTIEKDITENLQIPLNIPVDYNTSKIKLDKNGEFTVTNKVSGFGVTNPKDLIPTKVNKYGNVANQLIEPNRKDVTQIIEPDGANYKVSTDAVANPVIKDSELKGYNWTVRISSDTDLKELGYKINFTLVKGSGLEKIESNDGKVFEDNTIVGQFGIEDSKHHEPSGREIVYNLYTPVKDKQAAYMMDISVALTEHNKVGAERIVAREGYNISKIEEASPSRVGINNRTTILGEFTSEKTAKWTVTDAVSTGDKETKLPLETRKLEGNQNLESSNMAVYGLDEDGKMVVKKAKTNLNNQIPNQGTNPEDAQAVGNIAVYEYNTNKVQTDKKPISLSGVTISKYKDINVEQNWNLGQGLTMPEMTVKAVDAKKESTELGSATTTESGQNPDPAIRTITIEDVKIWNIENGGKATRQDIKIKQDFPTNKTYNGKTISYYENNNWYDQNKKGYFIHNRATVEKVPQYANFTLIKKGEGGKPLEGATFKLLGAGEAEITTDKEGKIHFNNIAPGDYKLIETKAPKGYKLNQETTFVNVDENGGISISGSSAKLKVGANPTITIAHNGYPGYMNAMHYARVNDDGSVTTYIYLKANSGTTNKDTRLNLRLNGSQDGKFNKTEDVKVYDVNPYYRESLKTTMIQQRVDQNTINEIGNTDVLTTPNKKPIRANRYTRDSFTGQSGYRITIPEERFANDWGFLVVANSPAGTSVTYDWLTDGSKDFTQNNARLQDQTVTPSTAEQANQETEITITNEKFQTRPVEIKKLGKDKKPIVGANFELKDADGNVISTATSQAADEKGKNAGLASFGEQPEGKYTIEETSAPEGYIKSDVIFDVTVDESNQVTYKPRFKSGNGTPVNGEDYLIEDEEQTQQSSDANVTKVSQTLKINESDEGDIGVRPQVWEAYRLESLIYNATIDLENTAPGQRFSIQFDRNLDFTQYFGEFPKVKVAGVDVADPYFDYTTNKLTYVYNEKSAGGKGQAKIELKGIIPSKYFAPNDGTYPFSVIVAPGKTGIEGQRIDIQVPADYGQYDYDGRNKEVPQSYYFRDVYKGDDGNWYVAALAYYNPDHIRESGEKELKFNWLSTNYQGANKNFFTWTGNGNKPAFSLRDVKIYRTSPKMGTIKAGNFEKKVNYNMPQSYGVRPEQDSATYNLVYSRAINPNSPVNNDRQGSITLNYDPGQIQEFGVITKNSPLKIKMPAIDDRSKDGYIIEQTFKIDDLYKFNNLWRVFCMTNNDFKSSFITRANYNKATGDQAGGEIPKFYSQKVALINKKYEPGNFKIKKLDESDRSKTLDGATFSLEDENKNVIYRSSGQGGIVQFSKLKPGIYTLREEKAPAEHIKSDKTWRVNVGIDGVVTIIEIGLGSTGETLVGKDTIELEVTNKPVATEFKVYKKDNENVPLQGAKFKITTTDGKQVVTTGESDKNGLVSFDKKLENGTYLLEEEAAPSGFKKLDKKWVIEINNNKAKVYNYIEGPSTGTDANVNKSILGVEGTKWVEVAKRPLTGWVLGDNRQTGYYNNWPQPFKLGTRIVGKNTKDKYVIQRYVINPEADTVTLNNASIHREKPWFNNMSWYAGTEAYKIFELDKAVDGNVEDIRLENYNLTDITKDTSKVSVKSQVITGQPRLYLDFKGRQITNPIVIDVKIPYTSEDGGVGTGMDLYTNKGSFWKSDYYDMANQIVEGDPVVTKSEAGNIKGAYISEGSLDVTNDRVVQEFSFKKVDDGGNQTDAITGATFKLQGPKKSDTDLGKEVWKKSGTDGTVKFDNLVPGIYKLTESGAPQGYEKANTDWTVTILDDGKIYIKDNNSSSQVLDNDPEKKWQKVDTSQTNANRHQGTYTSNGSTGRLATKIIEVNKATNKFRQVYIINGSPEYLKKPYFELHAEKETRGLTLDNTRIVSMNLVDRKSTPDNLINVGESVGYETQVYVKNNNQNRIKITPKNLEGEDKTIALTIETEMPKQGTVGTGLDFINYDESNHYWLGEYYDNADSFVLGPIQESKVDKNANLVVPKKFTEVQKPAARSAEILEEAGIQPISLMRTMYENPEALEISGNLYGGPVGAGDKNPYNVEASNANITVSSGSINTTDGTRTINVSVSPKDNGNTGQVGKNLQYVFLIDRSRDQALNISAADTPTIDKNINKFLTDLAEKAKNTNTNVDVTFIEYSKSGSKVLGAYNQNLVDLYNSANSFTYNMKTRSFGDRNNVTAKDILGKLGISSRPSNRNKDRDDGSQVLAGNIQSHYRQIVGNGKNYDKKYVLNIANFDAATATYYLENRDNPQSTKKYYAAENNWVFRDTTKPAQDRFESYVLHISQKAGQTQYQTYMSTNSGTLRYENDTSLTTNGIYTYKNFLESNLIKNEDFQSSGQVEQYLVKDAKINVGLNQNVVLKQGPSADKGSLNISPSNDGFTLSGINLKKGETLNLSYTIGLTDSATNNQDYRIHRTMQYTPNNESPVNLDNNLITRRNLESYNVSLIANNGSGQTTNISVNKGDNYTLPKCNFAPPSGQEFDVWLVYGQRHEPGDNIQITEDTNVVALWKNKPVIPSTVTITFDGNGGQGHMDPVTVSKGSTYYLPGSAFITPNNKTFDAWSVNGERKNPGDPIVVNNDTKVTALWKDNGTPQPQKHSITTTVTEGKGTLIANPTSQEQGKPVTITVKPANGYEIGQVTLNGTNVARLLDSNGQYTFPMGEKDVNVVANFNKKEVVPETIYDVGVDGNPNRKVVVYTRTTPDKAKAGELVEFTVTPNLDYEITDVYVRLTDGSGKNVTPLNHDGNKYSFIMPNQAVNIYANVQYVQPPDNSYIVGISQNIVNGSVSTDKQRAIVGDKVRIIATPIKDYSLESLSVTKQWGGTVDVQYDNQGPYFVMPSENVTVYAKFKEGQGPTPGPDQPDDKELGYLIYDPTNPDKILEKEAKITNKKAGITPKILKRSPGGEILPGATFTLNKMTDKTYSKVDTSFGELTATSDEKGDVIFKDAGKNVVKLQKGYYVVRETKAPTGYKKSTADWKIEVKDDGGRMYAEYQGPESTPSSFINDNTKSNAGYSADNAGIKYKSRLTYIDTESKTYIQRIYIDTRAYKGTDPLNLQITPKYKREEKDAAGQHPETIKDGVKTAYFTAYKLSNPSDFDNMNDPKLDKILRTYDLSNDNLSMIKTARWRPFDWGFDEDQLNLEKGVYIVDVEGFYDDVIITGKSDKTDKYNIPQEDLGKLDLHVDFYKGERHFKQLVFDKDKNEFVYKAFKGASYQGGASQVAEYIKSKEGADAAKAWSGKKDSGAKYANFVGKEVTYNGKTYKTGIIDPPIGNPEVHADTSVNLNPLYNSKSHQEIPKEGLEVINEEETFNITFSKHGRKDSKDDINSEKVTNNRLEGAVFKLQVRGPGGQYEDIPGTTVASAFNGYFGFRGLKPGRYRLMEVKAPEGYKPIKDPVLHFTVAYQGEIVDGQTGEITPGRGVVTLEYNEGNGIFQYAPDKKGPDGKPITPEDGKLVDYVTSATAKNMGKIINEVPGKGKVTLTKYDDNNNLLPGAEFKLTRISRDIKKDENPNQNDGVYTKTVGQDGKIVFDELPIGQYELEETKAPKGYQNKGKKWRFTVGGVGLDPYINDSDVGDRDISKSIEMTSVMSVLRPDGKDGTETEGNSKIHPHKGHALSFKNTFNIKDDTAIKAGDYFTIKLTDNIDLEGILKEKSQNLDLFADGVGTIAKAKYDKEAGTLTYVFTSYADQYNKTDFSNTITAHINRYKVQNSSTNEQVGMGIKDTNFTKNNIAVDYDLDMAKNPYNNANMTSKIVSFDIETGEFVQYFYINRDRLDNQGALTFKYKPSEAVSDLRFDFIRLDQNGAYVYDYNRGQYYRTDDYVNRDMPESFGVNERSNNLTKYGQRGPYELEANGSANISMGNIGAQNSVILKVTGKVKGDNISSFDTYAQLYNKIPVKDYYGNTIGYNVGYYVERTNGIRMFENKTTASAKLEIDAINPKNEIIFKKIDQEGKILPKAEFKLEKYYKDQGKWIQVTGSEKTADKDGLVKYEKLEPGRYALIETKAPDGYAKIEGHIQEFTVGEDGVITRQVVKEKPAEKPQSLVASMRVMLGSVASAITGDANTETVTEPVSKEPINVINYKEVEFEKVDGNDKSKKLEGAEFEVHYKEKDTDKDYSPLKVKKTVEGVEKEVTMTATSGKDGKFKLPITKDGYYALVETKAPDNYSKIPGNIREFKLENGKVKTLEKDPLKASYKKSTKGQITSEILSVDKDKKTFRQRIVINPKHESMTIPSNQSYIRIKETDWKITPKYKEALKKDSGIGGLVNVAILKKDDGKTIADLQDTEFNKFDAISFGTAGNLTGSRYGLKEMLGKEDVANSSIETTDSIVMEFTGKLDTNNETGTADQLFELVFDSSIDDEVRDKIDVKTIAENKPAYADHDQKDPIQVENRKAEYPHTGGMGTLIFTLAGLMLMSAAAYVYSRKRGVSYDD